MYTNFANGVENVKPNEITEILKDADIDPDQIGKAVQ